LNGKTTYKFEMTQQKTNQLRRTRARADSEAEWRFNPTGNTKVLPEGKIVIEKSYTMKIRRIFYQKQTAGENLRFYSFRGEKVTNSSFPSTRY
jgi:hypothetical protein